MKQILVLAIGTLLGIPAAAQASPDCALARDPVRCEAQRTAAKACTAKRGKEQRSCIEANMPALDCRRSQDPRRCEAQQVARELCRSKPGKELTKCLRDARLLPRRKPGAT